MRVSRFGRIKGSKTVHQPRQCRGKHAFWAVLVIVLAIKLMCTDSFLLFGAGGTVKIDTGTILELSDL